MKFIATTKGKLDTIPVASGQLIFSRDDRVIYLDNDLGRTSFQQIIILVTEDQRVNLTSPLSGFYFVKETKVLWNFDGEWEQVSQEPDTLFFTSKNEFPATGIINKIYVDNSSKNMYAWDTTNNVYIEMNTPMWNNIS